MPVLRFLTSLFALVALVALVADATPALSGTGPFESTTLAGYVSDHLGSSTAFLVLAAIAAAGLACIWALMPETRPDDETTPPADDQASAGGMAAARA